MLLSGIAEKFILCSELTVVLNILIIEQNKEDEFVN